MKRIIICLTLLLCAFAGASLTYDGTYYLEHFQEAGTAVSTNPIYLAIEEIESDIDDISDGTTIITQRMEIENVTANDTLTTAESGKVFVVDGNTATVTLTLPSVGASDEGVYYYISDVNETAASDVTISPADSDSINGTAGSFSSDGADELPCSITLVYNHDNTDWVVFINELADGTAAWDSN